MEIKVSGAGCKKCGEPVNRLQEVLAETNIFADAEKVEDAA